MADGGTTVERQLLISESAARRIAVIAAGEGPGTFLRISVSGGGCSGFQYSYGLDRARQDDDRSFTRDGAEIVVDDTSLDLLAGSELDFVEDLAGAFFQMKNPNAASSCGCGNSFSIG